MYYDRVSRDDDPDENNYFEINLTRSQLSDLICKNEDCEAARKFATRGIGPLAPKKPKDPLAGLEYVPPEPLINTSDVETQSPKKFPCGHPKCKYLKVYPDGTPIGCGKNTCKYSKTEFSQYPIKSVCQKCGGYSISGKTCFDISDIIPGETSPPETSKIVCGDECKPPPPLSFNQQAQKLPASFLPFDQLQAAARKERLATMQEEFLEAIRNMSGFVMDSFETHFGYLNPNATKTTLHRGLVFTNNNLYQFFVNTATITVQSLRTLLMNLWNQSVETKSATIPVLTSVTGFSQEYLPPVTNISHDILEYILSNFGMKSFENEFLSYIETIVQEAVLSNNTLIPPPEIPLSPHLSREELPPDMLRHKLPPKSKIYEKLSSKNFYVGIRFGHKFCVPRPKQRVPHDMGWLWNERFICDQRLQPLRYYKPGAVLIAVAKMIKEQKALRTTESSGSKKKVEITKKVKRVVEDNEAAGDGPLISLHKKAGEYLITMKPCKNPYWKKEDNKEYSPMIFLIPKTKDKIIRVDPDGTEKVLVKCDCHDLDEDSETSEEEYEINYTPPVALVDPNTVTPQRNLRDKVTQWYPVESTIPATKKGKKKGKKVRSKK